MRIFRRVTTNLLFNEYSPPRASAVAPMLKTATCRDLSKRDQRCCHHLFLFRAPACFPTLGPLSGLCNHLASHPGTFASLSPLDDWSARTKVPELEMLFGRKICGAQVTQRMSRRPSPTIPGGRTSLHRDHHGVLPKASKRAVCTLCFAIGASKRRSGQERGRTLPCSTRPVAERS